MPTLKGARTSAGVRVTDFVPDAEGDAMSVQIWYDVWRSGDRVLRYTGPCILPACRRLTWEADDGENDPRGVMGQYTNQALVACDHGMEGPDIAFCAGCVESGEKYRRALAIAMGKWTVPGEAPDTLPS